jgi:hypothetical protein
MQENSAWRFFVILFDVITVLAMYNEPSTMN